MSYLDANGILVYEETDNVSPLSSYMNAGQSATSAAIGTVAARRIYVLANIAARAALVASFVPSTTNPLMVFRTDASAGAHYEETSDGVNWSALSEKLIGYTETATYVVADVAARATLATAFSPTTAKPLYVFRTDATAGRREEHTTDGTIWYSVVTNAGLILMKPTSVTATGAGSSATLVSGKVTFATAATLSVNGCFTSAYDNYLIKVKFTSHVSTVVTNMRLRVAETDNSTANSYGSYGIQSAGGSTYYLQSNSDKLSIDIGNSGASILTTVDIDLSSPALASATIGNTKCVEVFGANVIYTLTAGLYHNQTTSYDGFTLLVASGSMGGEIEIYGYSNG